MKEERRRDPKECRIVNKKNNMKFYNLIIIMMMIIIIIIFGGYKIFNTHTENLYCRKTQNSSREGIEFHSLFREKSFMESHSLSFKR